LDRLENFRQQLASSADEWPARLVFGPARPFPDYDEPRVRGTLAGDGVGAGLAQLALAAGRDEGGDVLEAARLLDRVGGEKIGRRRIERDAGAGGWGLGARSRGHGSRRRLYACGSYQSPRP